jgi:DNA-binding XRE family transcriptional regulator
MNFTNNDFIMIRELHRLKQTEMAEIIGLSRSAVSMIESGELNVTERVARKLVDCFNITKTKLDYMRWIHEQQQLLIDQHTKRAIGKAKVRPMM